MSIAEIKRTYTEYIVHVTLYPILDGLEHIYRECAKAGRENKQAKKLDKNVKSKTTTDFIIECFKEVPNFSKSRVTKETERVKIAGQCYDWYEDLLNATIKSYTLLLSNGRVKKIPRVTADVFIHRIYINIAKLLIRAPSIMTNAFNSGQYDTLISKVRESIETSIRDTLQTKKILHDYIKYSDASSRVNNFREVKTNRPDEVTHMSKLIERISRKNKTTESMHKRSPRNSHEGESMHKRLMAIERNNSHKGESMHKQSPIIIERNSSHKGESMHKQSPIIIERNNSHKQEYSDARVNSQDKREYSNAKEMSQKKDYANKTNKPIRHAHTDEAVTAKSIFSNYTDNDNKASTENYGEKSFNNLINSLRETKTRSASKKHTESLNTGPIVSSDFLK